MILTTTDPVCIARDPRSLGPAWSELARCRARPVVFLTPEWLAVARAHDPRAQHTLAVAEPVSGICALAEEPDGTLTFAGGELTDEQDVLAPAGHERTVAAALGAWLAEHGAPRVILEYVPEDVPTVPLVGERLAEAGYAVRSARLVT